MQKIFAINSSQFIKLIDWERVAHHFFPHRTKNVRAMNQRPVEERSLKIIRRLAKKEKTLKRPKHKAFRGVRLKIQ